MAGIRDSLIPEVTAADYDKAYAGLRLIADVRPKIERCEAAGLPQTENKALCDILQRRLSDYMRVYFPNGRPQN